MFQVKDVEKNKTDFMPINFFLLDNRAVYELMWKDVVDPNRPQMAIRRMSFACWMYKATDTRSE
jgi:hypothetical protein